MNTPIVHKILKIFAFAVMAGAFVACGSRPEAEKKDSSEPEVEWHVSVNEPVSREHDLFKRVRKLGNERIEAVYSGLGMCSVADTTDVGADLRKHNEDLAKYDLTYGWLEVEDSADCDLVIYSRKPLISETVKITDVCSIPDDYENVLVLFRFADAIAWRNITASFLGRRLAIAVNGVVVNAPVVNACIEGGYCKRELPSLVVTTKGKHITVPMEDVVYAEVYNRKIIIHTMDADIEYYGRWLSPCPAKFQ